MNKYLLSLFLFGFLVTERVFSQGEDESGESSDESESSGEDSEDSESNNEGSNSGDVDSDSKFVVDRYTFDNVSYAPNPYPLDTCVQISVWEEDDPDQKYAIFTCSNNGLKVTKAFYGSNDSSCADTSTGSIDYLDDVNATLGDLRTFYCEGEDDFSFRLEVDCAKTEDSGESSYVDIVPYVCYFDGDSSLSKSNQWECAEDDDDKKYAYFYIYDDTDICVSDDISQVNATESCDTGVYTGKVAGGAYATKIVTNSFDCPGDNQGTTADDDTDEDDMASLVNMNNGALMLISLCVFAWMQ